jgi:hypothetical protein
MTVIFFTQINYIALTCFFHSIYIVQYEYIFVVGGGFVLILLTVCFSSCALGIILAAVIKCLTAFAV